MPASPPGLPSFLVRSEPAGGRWHTEEQGLMRGRWVRRAIGWQVGGHQNSLWMVPMQVSLNSSGYSKQSGGKPSGGTNGSAQKGLEANDWHRHWLIQQMLASRAGFWSPWLCPVLSLQLLDHGKVQEVLRQGAETAGIVVLRELGVAAIY